MLEFFDKVIDFFVYLKDFISKGIYDLIVSWFASFIISTQIALVKFKIDALVFSWDVAKEIIVQLDLSFYLNQAYGQLNSKFLSLLNFFRIPEGINIIISARVTKFVLRFLGL